MTLGATTPAANVPPTDKRNWRRFGRGDLGERSWCSTVVYLCVLSTSVVYLAWKFEGARFADGFIGYHFPCGRFSSDTSRGEWAV